MRNYSRFFSLLLSVFLLTFIITVCVLFKGKYVILNTTDSMAHGFYYVVHDSELGRGDIACFPVPQEVADIVDRRQWLPPGGFFLKRVVGLPGDFVCIKSNQFSISSTSTRVEGVVLDKDSLGRSLPHIHFCDVLGKDTYFVAFPEQNRSFDSRYFGPIHKSFVVGKARPIWTF